MATSAALGGLISVAMLKAEITQSSSREFRVSDHLKQQF